MEVSMTGFILYTINYQDCVSFYRDVLGLEILYTKETLTCFEFGGSYLMVEIDDQVVEQSSRSLQRDRTCLRLNVPNVKHACKALDKHKVKYTYAEYKWGTIAKFRDPDGNLIGFRSAEEHELDKLNKG